MRHSSMPKRPEPLPAKASVALFAISEIRCVRSQLAHVGKYAYSGGDFRSIVTIICHISDGCNFSSLVAVITAEGLFPLILPNFRANAKI